MIVRAVCEKCNYKWDLEMKPMEIITCPNCKTVYDALIVVNDPENIITGRNFANKTQKSAFFY